MAGLISLRAYARSRAERGLPGGSLAAVQKAAASGRVTLIEGKIKPELADFEWASKTDVDQQARGSSGGHEPRAPVEKNAAEPSVPDAIERDGYFASKARRELVEAQLAELELAEKLGVLVRKDVVSRETFTGMRTLRDRMLGVPDRIAAQCAAETDSAKVHEIITREIRDSLRAVTEALKAA